MELLLAVQYVTYLTLAEWEERNARHLMKTRRSGGQMTPHRIWDHLDPGGIRIQCWVGCEVRAWM